MWRLAWESGEGKKERKSQKEVSLGSLEPINKKSRKGYDAVNGSDASSVLPDSSKLESKLCQLTLKNPEKKKNSRVSGDESLQNLSSLSSSTGNLDKNVVPIPKRPRGLLRRKKFQSNHVSKQVGTSSSTWITSPSSSSNRVCSVVQMVKLTGDSDTPNISSEHKRKRVFDEFKENRSSRANSARLCNARDGHWVKFSGDPTSKKVHRNRGKKWEPAPQNQNHEEVEQSIDDSANSSKDLQEDDEENLEHNAARMLSSRFDPRCTIFSSNRKTPLSKSMSELSLFPPFDQDFGGPQSNYLVVSDSNYSDSEGRVLRPRKKYREARKRRHFYEMFSRDLDAYWLLNRRIKVFSPLDQNWYFGLVNDYDPERMLHRVKYDDCDEEWINLRNERFKLLLLPSEFPDKPISAKLGIGNIHVGDINGDVNAKDDDCIGSNTDSEPIISWLARLHVRQVKSSPLGIKKHKKSCLSKSFMPPMLSEEDAVKSLEGSFRLGSSRKDTFKLSTASAVPDRSSDGEIDEKSTMKSTTCSKDRKLPFVYFRRRFRKRGKCLGCKSEQHSGCRSGGGSITFLAYTVDSVGTSEGYDIVPMSFGMKQLNLKISFPLHWVLKFAFGVEDFCLYHILSLLQCGTVMTVWPKVRLEMLFVDNIDGLRFLLFEGCLMQAVAFVCLVLTAFYQPTEHRMLVDLQLPATSIRIKLAGFQNLGKQLVFVFYNFFQVKKLKWLYLDSKLKQHCLVTKQLPLSECTYDTIRILKSGIEQLSTASVCEDPASVKGFWMRSGQGIMYMGVSRELSNVNMSRSLSYCDEKCGWLPPFVLSFAAAPTFFLSLHLKLLMEHYIASICFRNYDSMSVTEDSENCGTLKGDNSCIVGNQVPENLENNIRSPLRSPACSEWLSCAKTKVEIDVLSMCNNGDWMKSSQKCQNCEVNLNGTSVGAQEPGKNEIDGIIGLHRHPFHPSESEQCVVRSGPSVPEVHLSANKFEARCYSSSDGIHVKIPPAGQVGSQQFNSGTESDQRSTSCWTMSDCIIRSPNPTAPRSIWHRNGHSSNSSSFGGSNIWADGRAYFTSNGSGKPRTRVSYLLPFGGYECSSKPRSHLRRGHPCKKSRNDNESRISYSSTRSPDRHLELTCKANVLITVGDRGWREHGAHVVLEFVDCKDWRLLVKLSGSTKYSYKAHHFFQSGTPNRYTHAMMWKGGKEWILEFPDRSQWTLFKEMHEECYNRNIQAASVKHIPIPGVCTIDESIDNATEVVPFVRSSLKYFRQVETEVDIALNSSRVLYDMDSDDEEWISKYQISSGSNGSSQLEISDEMFERTMDMFEKLAYVQQRDNFTSDEIEELMVGVEPIVVINGIHEHWRQKRQRKGMPLIRQFQPPLWERYQQQVKDWELAMMKANTILSNGFKEKATVIGKPPMFAFCLRPRGLEVPNKGSKQRSQRKVPAGGHNRAISRDHDGFHTGRKLNGFAFGEERVVISGNNYEYSDGFPGHQTSARVLSPRDAGISGYMSVSSDGSEKNQQTRFHKQKSNRMGTHLSPSDLQMMAMSYNQRTMGKRDELWRWNMDLPKWPRQKNQYQPEGFQRHRIEDMGVSDLDEFRLRDAAGAAQHASNMAKLKWEKAQRLLNKADLAIHKAAVALMTAEAIKASLEDSSDAPNEHEKPRA